MSLETYGWLVLLCPLGGCVLIGLTWRLLPSRVHGSIGTISVADLFSTTERTGTVGSGTQGTMIEAGGEPKP